MAGRSLAAAPRQARRGRPPSRRSRSVSSQSQMPTHPYALQYLRSSDAHMFCGGGPLRAVPTFMAVIGSGRKLLSIETLLPQHGAPCL